MIKRFCNSCEKEIDKNELYFCIRMNAVRGVEGIGPNEYYNDFCFDCVRTGKCITGLGELADRIYGVIVGRIDKDE